MADNRKHPVIHVHDGAVDEFMSTLLLTTEAAFELAAVVIVDADCIAIPAMQAAHKLQQFTGNPARVGLSHARGVNPFPWEYRRDCIRQNDVGALKGLTNVPPPFADGDELIGELLDKCTGPVTLLVTSPLTPITDVLRARPERADKIARLIWMGGAIRAGGNLDPATLPAPAWNAYAEWNAYWDPQAVDYFFEKTKVPMTIVPLDVTNLAKVSPSFLALLAQQAPRRRYSALALQSYSTVSGQPFYSMWDVVTTSYLTRPALFDEPARMKLRVAHELGGAVGTLYEYDRGREVDVVMSFKHGVDEFHQYVAAQLDR
jgi:purine nucleosidase